MKKYKEEDVEAWKIFSGLCEDFPELYDILVEKIEKDMERYQPDFVLTEEDKKQAFEKILKRIENEIGK